MRKKTRHGQPHGPASRQQVTIRCGGEQHRLALDDQGEVQVLDHDEQEIRRLLHYQEIGGAVDCECVHTLNFWRDFCARKCKRCRRTDFQVAVGALEAYRTGSGAAWQPTRPSDFSPLYTDKLFLREFIDRLAHEACGATEAMQFRWRSPGWDADGFTLVLWEGNRGSHLQRLERRWMRDFYFRGLGVVDGYLVLAASAASPGGWSRDGSRKFWCWTGTPEPDDYDDYDDLDDGLRSLTVVRTANGFQIQKPRTRYLSF